MKVTGSMTLRQVKGVLASWTDDAPPPVRTQLLVLRSLEKLKRKAKERRPLADALSRAMRAWRPRGMQAARLCGRSRYERRLGGLTYSEIADEDGVSVKAVMVSISEYVKRAGLPWPKPEISNERLTMRQLGNAIGVHERTIGDWTTRGVIPFFMLERRHRYSLSEVRAALAGLGWNGGSRLYDPNTARGQMALARAMEHGSGLRTCSKCRKQLPLSDFPPSSLKRKGGMCRLCKQAYTRASDVRRRRKIRSTRVEPVRILVVAERDGWCCGICGGKVTRETWSLDHVIPISKGGSHTYDNVVLAHCDCNSKRGDGRLAVQAPLFARL